MSNWFIFQQSSQAAQKPKGRRGKVHYYFLSIVLAASGTWFLFFILHTTGTPLINSERKGSSSSFFSAFSPSIQYWEDEILAWSEEYSLDPYLVATVMQIESCGHPNVSSPAGAQGLFQVMPYHFSSGEDMFDPEINALRGLTYLSQAYEKADGDIERTLAGYNGGHGQINLPREDWPEETKQYVIWGGGIYQDAHKHNTSDTALALWLKSGGLQLCREAERILGIN